MTNQRSWKLVKTNLPKSIG